jgi:hypothetical protein
MIEHHVRLALQKEMIVAFGNMGQRLQYLLDMNIGFVG